MTGNLIPTPIVNKNGVPTTVYKRPVQMGICKDALPAPAIGGSVVEQRTKNILSFASSVRKEAEKMFSMSEDDFDGIVADLKRYPDDLLERLVRADAAGEVNIGLVKRLVLVGGGQYKVNEALHFYPMLAEGATNYLVTKKVESLHHYPQLPNSVDYSSEPKEILEKATALFRLTHAVHDDLGATEAFDHSRSHMILKDDRLTELVLDHYQHIDQIIEVMKERSTMDPDLLRATVETDAPSLGTGIL